jgi:hypothetical protein
MTLKDQVKRATNKEKVRLAYLETPTAFSDEIAERTGLTKSQVKGARSVLVRNGQLPYMYGFLGAMYSENPERFNAPMAPVHEALKVAS